MRKILLAVLLAGLVLGFVSAPARAQTGAESDIPELNPLCWQKEDCMKARKQINTNIIDDVMDDAAAEAGWLSGVSAGKCDKNGPDGKPLWGKCLPVGKTVTSISFGGKKEFENIGEFIITIYNYGVGLAGIVAVLVIILSGAQWVASGGNSEMISSAKKRIGGAVIGLMIAYFSYVILNTINPALVNLRLPQVYMIRSQTLMPEYCSELPTSTSKFALVGPSNTDMKIYDFKTLGGFDYDWGIVSNEKELFSNNKNRTQTLACNTKFVVDKSGYQTCEGDWCAADDNICIPFSATKGTYKCEKGTIYGKITYNRTFRPFTDPGRQMLGWTHLIGNGWEDDEPVDITASELVAFCDNNSVVSWWQQVNSTARKVSGGSNAIAGYILATTKEDIDDAVKDCGGADKVRGFALMLEMDEYGDSFDEVHFVGVDGGKAKDLGRPKKENVTDSRKQYFIDKTKILSGGGIRIDIEASDIEDID